MKRVLTIQDISCLGKCSLTVALPLISAMGVETVVLPTALLSTHTMFKNAYKADLSQQMEPITEHWKSEGISFDAIYTGYLGKIEEIALVKRLIEDFRNEETLVFIDPAMGDNGRLYTGFDEHYARENASLCALGDVIVPNITEACRMTGMPFREVYQKDYVQELLKKLSAGGARMSVLTGVSLSEGKTGVMGYDSRSGNYFEYQNERIPASYHGTGDIFSSVTIGGLMNGLQPEDAFALASEYTKSSIEATLKNPRKPWYGVDFETTIPLLIRSLKERKAAAMK